MGMSSRPRMPGMEEDVEVQSDVDGFKGMSHDQVKESIRTIVVEKLKANGCDTEHGREVILGNWPQFNMHPSERKVEETKNFRTLIKAVTPESDGEFIFFEDWLSLFNELCNTSGFSIRHRVVFLKSTGGLCKGINDAKMASIKEKMKDILQWMPDYRPEVASRDNNYWFQVWADVMVMLVRYHLTIQHPDQMEDAFNKAMTADKYKLSEKEDDPLNKEWYKFATCWENQILMLKKRRSELLGAPLMVWTLFVRHWNKQSKRGIGSLMVNLVDKALGMLNEDPHSVLPEYHVLSDEAVEEIRRAGKTGAQIDTYTMIMERLSRLAQKKQLSIDVSSLKVLDQITRVQSDDGYEKGHVERKREKKVNLARRKESGSVQSGVSSLTLNSVREPAKDTPKGKPNVCGLCGLYHTYISVCPLVKDGKLVTDSVIKFRSVRAIAADGTSSFNTFWAKKFKLFTLPKFNMTTDEEQKKWFDKVGKVLSALPVATAEAIKRYQKENIKFINFCKAEEANDQNRAKSVVEKHRSTRKSAARKMRKIEEEEDEDDESSSESDGESLGGSTDEDSD